MKKQRLDKPVRPFYEKTGSISFCVHANSHVEIMSIDLINCLFAVWILAKYEVVHIIYTNILPKTFNCGSHLNFVVNQDWNHHRFESVKL